MKKQINVSIVIPVYNEEEGIKAGVLDEVVEFLEKKTPRRQGFVGQGFSWEVILVDDGSRDKTYKLLQNFSKQHSGFKLMRIPHGGKFAAVSAGVLRAKGDFIFFSDFDQSTPVETVDKFLEAFGRGADVVIADRYIKGARRQYDSFLSRARSMIFNFWVRFLLIPKVMDTQCGFKAFRKEVVRNLFTGLKVHEKPVTDKPYMGAFDVELLFFAKRVGLKIVSVPVVWRRVVSNKLTIIEPVKMLLDVVRIKWLDARGVYGEGKSPGTLFDKTLPFLVVVLLTLPAIANILQPGYFAMHDDMQVMRQLQMDKCFADLQIPCRWVPDLGYGYGYPLFNYYPPMPYLLGQIFHWLGFSFLNTIKMVFAFAFLVSAFTMYLLAREFWGRLGGVAAAVLYIWAPYHIVDVYVRGAMNESWALAWFPAILWGIYKVIQRNSWKYVLPLAFFLGMLALSHNPMMMVFAPGAFVWAVLWLVVTKNASSIVKLGVGGLYAFSLAAFFTLPVIFETKYAHVETLVIGYFNYLAHYVDLRQLFINRDWGYGASFVGTSLDGMSFQVGHFHWVATLIAIGVAWFIRKASPTLSLTILFFFFWTYGYTFLAHQRSTPIWMFIKPLEFLQFPWRFLSLTIVGASFLAGSLVLLFQTGRRRISGLLFVLIIAVGLAVFNRNYVSWREYYPKMTDEEKFSGELWRLQVTSGIFDYLPIWAPLPPADPAPSDAQFVTREGEYKTLVKKSNLQKYEVEVTSQNSVLRINTFYFPGWKVFVDGKEVGINPERDPDLGRMLIDLSPGKHTVVAKFTNTPIRSLANLISLISWLVLVYFVLSRLGIFARKI